MKQPEGLTKAAQWVFAVVWLIVCMTACARVPQVTGVEEEWDGVWMVFGPSPIRSSPAKEGDVLTLRNDVFAVTLSRGESAGKGGAVGGIAGLAFMEGPDSFGLNLLTDLSFWVEGEHNPLAFACEGFDVIRGRGGEAAVEMSCVEMTCEGKGSLEVRVRYALEKGASVLKIESRLIHSGEGIRRGLTSGFTMKGRGGFMSGPFGVPEPDAPAEGIPVGRKVEEPFGNFVVSYGEDYAVSLLVDEAESYRGGHETKSLYHQYDLAPAETRVFRAELQLDVRGQTSSFLERVVTQKGLSSASIRGVVKVDDGRPVADPVLLVKKECRFTGFLQDSAYPPSGERHAGMQPFIWHVGKKDGSFAFVLPEGDYHIVPMGMGYKAGKGKKVSVRGGEDLFLAFSDTHAVGRGGHVELYVTDRHTGNPVDAVILVDGPVPPVKYLRPRTRMTDLESIGRVSMALKEGGASFRVLSGYGFTSLSEEVSTWVVSGEKQYRSAAIETHMAPEEEGWFSADLCHRMETGRGGVSAEDLVMSQLGARLDFVVDSGKGEGHTEVRQFSDARMVGLLFCLAVDAGRKPEDSTVEGPVREIVPADAVFPDRAFGSRGLSMVLPVWKDNGSHSREEEEGSPFHAKADLLGLVPEMGFSKADGRGAKILEDTMHLWNGYTEEKNRAYYFAGGSGSSDPALVGEMRTYARVEGAVSPAGFMEALGRGRSYVSTGPLFFTSRIHFGDLCIVKTGEDLVLDLDAFAVGGLAKVEMYTEGKGMGDPLDRRILHGSVRRETLSFTVKPDKSTWYSFMAWDMMGRVAISNPVWVWVDP
ncbi:hypothetical protein OOT00_04035 [Desulfobotulus sp. H1]|uniref:Carboxypeptidase regulatory-like domain-containing protein n=1 Tax=Desulfobotulus pelophilus TaxID=2823377 RepID=A0ABT3N7Y8_9BACT|nr:hypothetical protein [Desulfobotulus pelophilus]MCW7753152.1 hypothetical protein [Desulfobotulus pelophilus]